MEKALTAWGAPPLPRDNPAAGRLAFRPLFEIFTRRTKRDRETAQFLAETQRAFYEETIRYLRSLGFRGLITASNWTTANNDILGPLDKFTCLAGDFMDRHGYFGCNLKGNESAWSVRNGQTYADRSALRFAPEKPGAPHDFENPVMDLMFNFKPSMISETTWNRPNRHRGEAPLFYAAYGALQDTDAIVHFALDGIAWQVKPGFFMQPWTLMSPTQVGQFPAAALIYRRGLVKTGPLVASASLSLSDAFALAGSPLSAAQKPDAVRGDSNPSQTKPASLLHFLGRTNLTIGATEATTPAPPLIDNEIISSGELTLDPARGIFTIAAPQAQGASGNLRSAGPIDLPDLIVSSPRDVIHIVVVALDGQPLATSSRILVQAMTEERATGFARQETAPGLFRVTNIGADPWEIRAIEGEVRFKRADAGKLAVTALDGNGRPVKKAGTAALLRLEPGTAYYLIGR